VKKKHRFIMFKQKTKTMFRISTICILSVFAGVLFSCSGKKFDYASAYKFNPKITSHLRAELNDKPSNLSVSSAPEVSIVSEELKFNETERSTPEVVPVAKTKKEVKTERRLQKLTQKIQRKVERKTVKKTAAAGMSITGKVYAGLVIGAAGLVLMILGGSTLSTIGSIGLLVGVVLIVWGLLE
jgi:hypothetical protein